MPHWYRDSRLLIVIAVVCPLVGGMSIVSTAAPLEKSELIFPLQEKHVHSSCIVECPNGDMLVCWFHGSGERRSPDVVIQGARLKKGANEWSPVFPMADTPDFPDCNPVLFIDGKNELWLIWIAVPAERWEDSLLRIRKAREYQADGPPQWYWQDLLLLKPGERFYQTLESAFATMGNPPGYGDEAPKAKQEILEMAKNASLRQRGWMTRTHLNVLPSGRILIPLYSDGYLVGLMAISDDGGETWRSSAPIPGLGLNQPSVVRKQDGTLVAYMRDEGPPPMRVLVSQSKDEGDTWSPAVDLDIPNPDSSLEVIALRDGRWVMAYNDTEAERESLALSMSDDEGATWKWIRHIEKSPGGAFHYPSLIQTRDGLVHLTYTYQPGRDSGKSIKHVTFNADWITQGD